MADEEKLLHWKISTGTGYNTLKTHTKYAHTVSGRPTRKDVERFRNKSVRKPYDKARAARFLVEGGGLKRVIQVRGGRGDGWVCATLQNSTY